MWDDRITLSMRGRGSFNLFKAAIFASIPDNVAVSRRLEGQVDRATTISSLAVVLKELFIRTGIDARIATCAYSVRLQFYDNDISYLSNARQFSGKFNEAALLELLICLPEKAKMAVFIDGSKKVSTAGCVLEELLKIGVEPWHSYKDFETGG
jgi:hypothetical protein